MPLETATYISQLVAANPAGTDSESQGANHLRLVKAVLQAQFPNFTAAALNSTQAEIDAQCQNGATVLADAGANFKTNSTDGLRNPASGEVDVEVGGVAGLKVTASTVTVPGGLAVTNPATGPGFMPLGGAMPWFTGTLPAGFGTWAWMNGQAISRTTYAALFAVANQAQTGFGPGDGSTTFQLPDLREVALVGNGTMGSTSDPGRITNWTANALSAFGTFIGECLHLLTTGEMPSHTHAATVTDPGHVHGGVTSGSGGQNIGSSSSPAVTVNTNTASATTGISVSNASQGGGGTHNTVPPSVVCNWIMRIA